MANRVLRLAAVALYTRGERWFMLSVVALVSAAAAWFGGLYLLAVIWIEWAARWR